jgi:ubiquinone biosynthesis protein
VNLKTVQNLGRFKEIVSVFARYGFGDVLSHLGLPGRQVADRISRVDSELTPFERLRMAFDDLGPSFVKFGQILSLRSDMLPKALTQELAKLQDKAALVPVDQVVEAVEESLGRPLKDVFSVFDKTPLASASLSQVHRAVLREDRTVVALKVRRPEIRAKVDLDLGIFESIAKVLHERMAEVQIYDLPGLVDLIRRTLERELDFEREARYMKIAESRMRHLPGIHIPKANRRLSSRRLLVMEYIRGDRLMDLKPETLEDPAEMARQGLHATVQQILEDGFFHADPHPGNLLVMEGKTLCLLDWGMVGRLTAEDRIQLADLLAATVEKDSERLVETLLTVSRTSEDTDPRALEREVLELLDVHMAASVADIRIGELMLDITDLIRKYHLRVPPDLFMMIKALVTAEASVRLIYPQLDVVSEMLPHVRRLAAQRFQPRRIVDRLKVLLLKLATSPGQFPKRIGDIVAKMERGDLRLRFEHHHLDDLTSTLDKIFSRLTLGVILGAMIIGSSLIVTTGLPPLLGGYSLLGLAGYCISAVVGLWLVYDILRNR